MSIVTGKFYNEFEETDDHEVEEIMAEFHG